MDIDIQWGGYYAYKEEGEDQYKVFRLLDFNRYIYYAESFQEKFSEVPSLEDVMGLSPYFDAPIDSKAFLQAHEIHLLGGPALTEEDLEGYRFYLEVQEMKESDKEELFRNIIEFGNLPPYKVTLTLVDGELEVTER